MKALLGDRRRKNRAAGEAVEFALDLTPEAVTLHERGPEGKWQKFAAAELDDPEFTTVIGLLQADAEAYAGARKPVLLWLPPDQILRKRAWLGDGQPESLRLQAAFDHVARETVFRPEDIAVAVGPADETGIATILVTFAQTCREARDYARRWGFLPGDVSTRHHAEEFAPRHPVFRLRAETPPVLPPPRRAQGLGRRLLAGGAVAVVATGIALWTLRPWEAPPVPPPEPAETVQPATEPAQPPPTAEEPAPPTETPGSPPPPSAVTEPAPPPAEITGPPPARPAAPPDLAPPATTDVPVEPAAPAPSVATIRTDPPDLVAPALSAAALAAPDYPADPAPPGPEPAIAADPPSALSAVVAVLATEGPGVQLPAPTAAAVTDREPRLELPMTAALPAVQLPTATEPAPPAATVPEDVPGFQPPIPIPAPRKAAPQTPSPAPVAPGEAPAPAAEEPATAPEDLPPIPIPAPRRAAPTPAPPPAPTGPPEAAGTPSPASFAPEEMAPPPAEDTGAGPGYPSPVPIPAPRTAAAAPESQSTAAATAITQPPSRFASLSAPLPTRRPAGLRRSRATAPAVAAPASGGSASATVGAAATESGLPLDQTALLGIASLDSGRKAILRLPDGGFRSVVVGDVIDGWKVSTIGSDSMRFSRKGKDRTLLLIVP